MLKGTSYRFTHTILVIFCKGLFWVGSDLVTLALETEIELGQKFGSDPKFAVSGLALVSANLDLGTITQTCTLTSP